MPQPTVVTSAVAPRSVQIDAIAPRIFVAVRAIGFVPTSSRFRKCRPGVGRPIITAGEAGEVGKNQRMRLLCASLRAMFIQMHMRNTAAVTNPRVMWLGSTLSRSLTEVQPAGDKAEKHKGAK